MNRFISHPVSLSLFNIFVFDSVIFNIF